ncbi:glycosyltransferase [Candidatus Methylopumilus universalis]|uniref:Glycosyltransferase n=1 Tax=Candidatus Methylopumilus universalis TaxID=2588536 RepID=A0AAX1EZV2_9PROT|nr:glycosyltransferase family 2 protein [Candidatus Methylopumilus universalis]QDC41247.1 glycosyltransferase [Candidatus Methylopumilus universalis]QDC42537.1 glycosyltransferase [Candidatus Methylopumilus universalis]QDC54923.1 glycosyltransferase [Candidatus Methylopumilus universalis]QDC56204.1 glycosyltransferase [Candidatus Methylopumilus universalis]QDC57486.1 glycosyltransferase [Candidatus Methylopumilus universalis]
MVDFFNYIVPIFNKEDILPLTLEGLDRCASKNSKIYTVIDGCTDRSEEVVDTFIKNTGRDVIKIHMPNVHMLRSVNAGLKLVERGFSVIMQDDIILDDESFESKISDLYHRMGPRLGIVSLRLASNVKSASMVDRIKMRTIMPMISETDFIMNEADNQEFKVGDNEKFYHRMSAINGPNIIPWSVKSKIGLLDEALAPYGYDDPEYCLRAMKEGFVNGLFPLRFKSDVAWGGTRRSKKFLSEVRRIHCRNRKYIWDKHGDYISWLWKTGGVSDEITASASLDGIPDSKRESHF